MDSIDALLFSNTPVIVQKLETDQYQVEFSKGKAYLGCKGGKVVGIFNGQVQEKMVNIYNTLQAQVLFARLQPEIKNLAKRTAVKTNVERLSLYLKAGKLPGKQQDLILPNIGRLSERQIQLLKFLIETEVKGVYFNNQYRAITSLDDSCSYVPDAFDSFTICKAIMPLDNYEAINKQWQDANSQQ